jgi:hypothetical protein
MAFGQFSEQQVVKTIDTGEEILVGAFKLPAQQELKHIRLGIYINGVSSMGGSETMQLKINSDPLGTKTIFSSDVISINSTTIPTLGSTNWLGLVRFDFERQSINPNITYYPSLVVNNYTRNADTYYISGRYDFPAPAYPDLITGNPNNFTDHPIIMQIFGFSEIQR